MSIKSAAPIHIYLLSNLLKQIKERIRQNDTHSQTPILSVIILEGLVGVDRISNHATGKRRIKDKTYSIYKKNIKNRK